jgi:hypothetical protein
MTFLYLYFWVKYQPADCVIHDFSVFSSFGTVIKLDGKHEVVIKDDDLEGRVCQQ